MSNPAILALTVLTTHVDALETNHVFNKGKQTFDQVIIWEHSPATGRFQVRQWFMTDQQGKLPCKNFVTGEYEIMFWDIEAKAMRKITSKIHHESWGEDRERVDKLRWPDELRYRLPSRLSLVRPIEGEE